MKNKSEELQKDIQIKDSTEEEKISDVQSQIHSTQAEISQSSILSTTLPSTTTQNLQPTPTLLHPQTPHVTAGSVAHSISPHSGIIGPSVLTPYGQYSSGPQHTTYTYTPSTIMSHHQEKISLQQQLTELYCQPPSSEVQEKNYAFARTFKYTSSSRGN